MHLESKGNTLVILGTCAKVAMYLALCLIAQITNILL